LVEDLMKREIVTVGPDASMAVAARVVRDREVGGLPVLDGERLIGMITDRDIVVRGVAEGLDPDRAMVRETMSANAIACSVEHTVEQARALMATNLIKHLPVLDEGERVVGGSSRCGTSPRSSRRASPMR
jgi:CBS domain-containing protein